MFANRSSGIAAILLILIAPRVLTGQQAPAKITGTVSCRDRMALPPEAEINVALQDTSPADEPARTISEIRVPATGRQMSIPFELTYDPEKIEANHHYSVRATIRVEGLMVCTTTQSYPVITRGAPRRVNLVLQRVGRSLPKASATRPPGTESQAAVQSEVAAKKTAEPGFDNTTNQRADTVAETPAPAESPAPEIETTARKPATPTSAPERRADTEAAKAVAESGPEPPPPVVSSDPERLKPFPPPEHKGPSPAPPPPVASPEVSQPNASIPAGNESTASELPDAPSAAHPPSSTGTTANALSRLADTQWKLFELDGKNVFFAPSELTVSLAFSPDGQRIAGSAGCNAFLGTFTDENGVLTLQPAGMTLKACSDSVMQREDAFAKMLRSVDSYQLDGAVLSLLNGGKVLAKFRNSEDDLANQP